MFCDILYHCRTRDATHIQRSLCRHRAVSTRLSPSCICRNECKHVFISYSPRGIFRIKRHGKTASIADDAILDQCLDFESMTAWWSGINNFDGSSRISL